jgi:LmbE family N-acetylglucosaminyl deacetylase
MGDRRLLLVHAHPDDEPSMTEALKVLGTARHHWLGGRGRW